MGIYSLVLTSIVIESGPGILVKFPMRNGGSVEDLCQRLPKGKSRKIPSNPIKPAFSCIFHIVMSMFTTGDHHVSAVLPVVFESTSRFVSSQKHYI